MQNGYISIKFGAGCSSRPIIAYICRSNPAKKPLTYINDMNKIGIICIISITLLAVVLAACATTPKDTAADTTPADTAADTPKEDTADTTEDTSDTTEPAAEGGKNIV